MRHNQVDVFAPSEVLVESADLAHRLGAGNKHRRGYVADAMTRSHN